MTSFVIALLIIAAALFGCWIFISVAFILWDEWTIRIIDHDKWGSNADESRNA